VTAGTRPNSAAALREYPLSGSYPEQKTSVVPGPQWRGVLQPPELASSLQSLPMVELEDVELTSVPVMVYFKIRVRPMSRACPPHHVMKTFRDLQDLDEALSRELPRAEQPPKLPSGRTQKELTEATFCARLGAYISGLARSPTAVETYSFKNFFQLSDEYQRWLPDDVVSSGFTLSRMGEAKYQTLAPAALLLPAASTASTVAESTQFSAPYRTDSPDPLLTSRSQPSERTAFASEGTPSRGQHEASCSLLRPAGSTVPPRAPSMPQTAPEMPKAPSPKEAAGESQALSSDELGSSAETYAGERRHRRRRPWCVICMANPQEMAIDPCGHMSMCYRCSTAVQACPVCRGPIEKALRVYIA